MAVGGIGCLRQLLGLVLLLELLLQAVGRDRVALALSGRSIAGIPLPPGRSRSFTVLCLLIVDYYANIIR